MSSTTVQSVRRALILLGAMNERDISSLQELQRRTQLPKATVHRLLSTLQALKYVYSGPDMYGTYRLTEKVRELSSGLSESNRLADMAGPILVAATKRLRWPLSLGTIDGSRVRIISCAMPYSPYAMRNSSLGETLDLLLTAPGQVYLSFCTALERRMLLKWRHADASSHRPPTIHLRTLLRQTRRQGYAVGPGAWSAESTALAIPLFAKSGELIGVLACSAFQHTIDPVWVARTLPFLKCTATQIAESLAPNAAATTVANASGCHGAAADPVTSSGLAKGRSSEGARLIDLAVG
jgi:IclR family mhp operon transcriptional activator